MGPSPAMVATGCPKCSRGRHLRWWLVALNLTGLGFTVALQVLYHLPIIGARLVEGPLAAWVPIWQWMWADGHGLLWGPPLLIVATLLAMPQTGKALARALPALILWASVAALAVGVARWLIEEGPLR